MKKISITDDDYIRLTAEVSKAFPEDVHIALAFFSAITAAEIFENASDESETKVYRRTCDRYEVGDFTFYDYTGGSLEEKHRVEYYKAGGFVDKQLVPDKEGAFKYILSILSDYII